MAWFHSLLTSAGSGGSKIEEGDFTNSSSDAIPVQMQDYDILVSYIKILDAPASSDYLTMCQFTLKPGSVVGSTQTKHITCVSAFFGANFDGYSTSKCYYDDDPNVLKPSSSASILKGTWHYIAIKF